MKEQTSIFIVLIGLILLNLGLSLSLTFSVPLGEKPWPWMKEHLQAQLSLFLLSGIFILGVNFYLLFGYPGPVPLLPPFQLSTIYAVLVPVLFLSIYFVQRPVGLNTGSFDFYKLIPVTFYNLLFFVVLGILNSIIENVKAVHSGRISP